MKELLMTIARAYGPTGREGTVANVISGLVKDYVDELTTDALGNLIATRRGKPGGKKIMLAAHMDHIGFIVTCIDEKGFLRVHNVGGISRVNSFNRRVVFESGLSGVLSHEVENFNPSTVGMTALFIDIGAQSREEAEKLVDVGDIAVYAPDVFALGEHRVAGPAMDNRAGCALAIAAMRALGECENEVVCVFTTQEEVGLRGAKAAAYSVNPDVGIAMDVTLCGDTPKGVKIAVAMGEGIAVKVLDSSVVCNPWVVKALEDAADRAGAKHQREVLSAGGTDAGAIQATRGGIPAGVLSIPCRYVHSAAEVVDARDIEAGVKTLAEFIKGL